MVPSAAFKKRRPTTVSDAPLPRFLRAIPGGSSSSNGVVFALTGFLLGKHSFLDRVMVFDEKFKIGVGAFFGVNPLLATPVPPGPRGGFSFVRFQEEYRGSRSISFYYRELP